VHILVTAKAKASLLERVVPVKIYIPGWMAVYFSHGTAVADIFAGCISKVYKFCMVGGWWWVSMFE